MTRPETGSRSPFPEVLEEAPRLVKDLLRGLRHNLRQLDPTRDLETLAQNAAASPFPLPLSPLALAAELVRETRKAAKFGSSLARDVIDPQQDDALLALGEGRQAERAAYVQARYQATRYLMKRMGHNDTLLLERPIARVWAETANTSLDNRANSETHFAHFADQALRLTQSGAIPSSDDRHFPFRIFSALALAEALLYLSPNHDSAAVMGALEIAAEVMALRQSTFDAIMDGFDPSAALAAELKLLAPHLAEA
ncbi:MAG: hypothetical protein WCO61_08360 [Alphaproteobacteria bacterium]